VATPLYTTSAALNTMIQRSADGRRPTTATCTMRAVRGGILQIWKTRPDGARQNLTEMMTFAQSMLDTLVIEGSTTRSINTGWGAGAEPAGRRY